MTADCQAETSLLRAALYVDGFNLYHAVDELDEPFLKWFNTWRLGEMVISKRTQTLARVVFCTARYPGDPQRQFRQDRFLEALVMAGVDVVRGHFVHEDMNCRDCDHTWKKPTEKESDVNLALSVYEDASLDRMDDAYLLTADSDQAATARFFKARFPHKRLFSVSPPGRKHSAHILKYTDHHVALNRDHIERALFRHAVNTPDGSRTVLRPREYSPPEGYVHWDDRPKRGRR